MTGIDWSNEKDCIKAVTEDWRNLGKVKNQTKKICLIAINGNGRAINFVKKKTVYMCYKAYKRCTMSLEGINDDLRNLAHIKLSLEFGVENHRKFVTNFINNLKKDDKNLYKYEMLKIMLSKGGCLYEESKEDRSRHNMYKLDEPFGNYIYKLNEHIVSKITKETKVVDENERYYNDR